MIKRKNELVYIKRHYLLPFKPLMDWEYKKFGYKKCDRDKGDSKIFNTAYYVRHKERPIGLCDLLYYVNLPFSLFRAIVFPLIPVLFILSLFGAMFMEMDKFVEWLMIAFVLSIPAMFISVLFGSFGYKFYHKNDTNGKLDRIMKSQGWPAWTSYRDNDPRFTPPGSKRSGYAPKSSPGHPVPTETNDEDDDVIILTAENGEEIRFAEVAAIAHKGVFYAILRPVDKIAGMDDDEVIVFKVTRDANGEDAFETETDDTVIDAVLKEYNRLYSNAR